MKRIRTSVFTDCRVQFGKNTVPPVRAFLMRCALGLLDMAMGGRRWSACFIPDSGYHSVDAVGDGESVTWWASKESLEEQEEEAVRKAKRAAEQEKEAANA